MNKFESVTKPLMWFMALLLAALVAGCGGGSQDPILGGGGGGGAITAPTVTITSPVNNTAVLTTTSTIVATFSEAMDPATLTPASFTLTCIPAYAGGFGAIVMSAGNTVATLPLLGALPVTAPACTATVTTAAKSLATGLALGAGAVPNPWTFTTNAPPPVIATVIPGTGTCAAANADLTIPKVISSDPTSGNLNATTETTGAGGNKLITATFSLAMDPATINTPPTSTFTLINNTTGLPVAGTVAMSGASIANTIATFTTPTLPAGNDFTATITTVAKTPGVAGKPLACNYAWDFTTVNPAAPGLAAVNMGLAAPFGIAAHSNAGGVTNTPTVPLTIINGDVLLNPVAAAACNAVAVDLAGGFGLCAGSPPTLGGTSKVYSPLYDPSGTLATVVADLNAAFLSITPPAGPPAAGSLGGATAIAAGTTLGDVAGNPYVLGDNYFTPGVYQSITSILITGDLTLDALGNPDAVFVFQSSSTVGTAAGFAPPGVRTRILLIGGAKASNVWWQAGTDATLQLYSEFQGNILAARDITMLTGATSCGRLMAGAWVGVGAGSGQFVFDSNVVSVPGQPFAPPAGYSTTCQ